MSLLEFFIYITLINWSIVTLLWLLIKKKDQFYLKDLYWGGGIILLSISAIFLQGFLEIFDFHVRQILVNSLAIVIGTNILLSSYKKAKLKAGIVKKPYERTLSSYKDNFLKMGLLQVVVISPIISVNYLPGMNSLNFIDFIGLMLFSLGFYVEAKSNHDLLAFKAKKAKEKEIEILSSGLWRLSRHPNYFGHLLQWLALYVIACSSIGGEWSFYGPLTMYLIMLNSIKGTEKRLLSSFTEYKIYSSYTNRLIPDFFIGRKSPLAFLRPLVPFKGLTVLAGYFSNLESPFIKGLLIKLFCYFYKPNLTESIESDTNKYNSFNEFFTRKLKSESRPINTDVNIITSPVDGTVVQLGNIVKETLIQAKGIKYSVSDLIKDESLAKTFKDGFFITIYLAPTNYHRIHSPFSGTIEKTKYLEGNLYSVNAKSTQKIKSLYSNNERTFYYIKSDNFYYGLVGVGAAMVGSIVPFWNTKTNPTKRNLIGMWNQGPEKDIKAVNKGQELGYFQMGSTIILLFPSGIEADKNFLYESKAVKFGEELINLSKK